MTGLKQWHEQSLAFCFIRGFEPYYICNAVLKLTLLHPFSIQSTLQHYYITINKINSIIIVICSIGYPVVTLGFGFKSYVGYRMKQRRQKEIQKENETYYSLLREVIKRTIANNFKAYKSRLCHLALLETTHSTPILVLSQEWMRESQ